MNRIIVCCLAACIALVAVSQSIPLNGVVVIQNSRYETGTRQYVKDAAIRAPFAKATSSDSEGRFALLFTGVAAGASIRLSVDRPGLALVNTVDLENVVLGQRPLLHIVMADPNKRARAQEALYGVALAGIEQGFQKKLDRLRDPSTTLADRLGQAAHGLNDKMTTLADAMEEVTKQRDQAIEHAHELARTLSEVDLDEASDLYRSAYERFRSGAIDSALAILDGARLDADYRAASEQQQRGGELIVKANIGIRNVFDSYGLREEVLEATLDLRSARRAMDAMLAILDRDPEAFDPLVKASTLRRSGSLYKAAGDYQHGLREQLAALDQAERHLPVGHPERIQILCELGNAYLGMGLPNEALLRFNEGVKMGVEGVAPPPDAMASMHNGLAIVMGERGDRAAQIREMREAIRTRGPEAHNEPMLHANFGIVLIAAGQHEEALAEEEKAMDIARRVLPRDHPVMANVLDAYGSVLMWTGEMGKAMEIFQECLAIQERTLGPDHPALVNTYSSIAAVHSQRNDLRAEIEARSKAIAIREKVVGELDEAVAGQHGGIGWALSQLGDTTGAFLHLRKCLSIRRQLGSTGNSDAIINYRSMVDVQLAADHKDSAVFYARKALDLAEQVFGPESQDAAASNESVGDVEYMSSHYDTALPYYRRFLALTTKNEGPDSPVVGQALADIGLVQMGRGDPDSAQVYYGRSLAVYGKTMPPTSPTMVRIHTWLANAMADAGRTDSVLAMCEHDLPLLTAAYGPGDSRVAATHMTMGNVYATTKDNTAALLEYQAALLIYRNGTGDRVFRMSRMHYLIGRVHLDGGDLVLAEQHLDSSFVLKPTRDVAWQQYRLALEQRNDMQAVERLATFMRLPEWSFGYRPVIVGDQRTELSVLAERLGRTDLLREFGLK